MRSIDILTKRMETLFSEGKTVEDFESEFLGTKRIEIDKVAKELFGDPINIIKDFEEKFAGESTDELVDLLVKAGLSMLSNYERLITLEIRSVTPSMTEIVCAKMNGETDLDEINRKRIRVSGKWFTVVMAMRYLEELNADIKNSGPRAPKRMLNNAWFGPLPK